MILATPVPTLLAPAAWWGCVAAASAVVVAPLLLVDVPPVLDYPNHLARMVVLASGRSDPALARMYAAHWGLIPNLAMDLVVPPLLHITPVYWAGRLFLAVALLLRWRACWPTTVRCSTSARPGRSAGRCSPATGCSCSAS